MKTIADARIQQFGIVPYWKGTDTSPADAGFGS
jgi:hypothetical protein